MTNLKENKRLEITIVAILFAILVIFVINIAPFNAFGGAIWFNGGPHYISDSQIAERTAKINTPKEVKVAKYIESSTQQCDDVIEGFCKQNIGSLNDELLISYSFKSQVSPAVSYRPGTSDRQEIIGYCTLCMDGSFSPSCAVGRGACSWHGGVAQYDYPEYRTILGTSEVLEQSAKYTYALMSYQDSDKYVRPESPDLNTVVNFAD